MMTWGATKMTLEGSPGGPTSTPKGIGVTPIGPTLENIAIGLTPIAIGLAAMIENDTQNGPSFYSKQEFLFQ